MKFHSKHLAPALIGLALAAQAIFPAQAGDYPNPAMLTETDQLDTMLDDPRLRILDVRPGAAYTKGHIPGAAHLDADAVSDRRGHVDGVLLPVNRLAAMLGALGVDRDTRVVIYDDNGGFHASRLFWILEYLGHRQTAILNGGIPKWIREGRALTERTPRIVAKIFQPTMTPRRHASADWLLDHRTSASTVVIDVRPPKMYKAGHIPWAHNIPWKRNLSADGTLRPAEDLVAHFARRGITRDKNVAIHCQNGKAAAHSYFTLRLLGFPRVRSYDRSWAEWGTAEDLPKATGTRG